MSVFDQFGVSPIINAKGPATRLSGGIMRPEVSQAMVEASQRCVDMAELQAAASKAIAAATGAEAGYVASGAAACLLLATAACVTGLDPGAMARLPDTTGMKNEVVMVRSQRNFYDHAVRAAGVKIIEVGLPDRYAGAGVRDAEAWEIDDAITERTAAIFYVADAQAQPPLKDVTGIGRARGVPVIVDAAAQLPPQSNLKRFITEGADLVAYSGGKALGGPQASGILCGRRDLIMAAALQHLDHDIYWDMWEPPAALIDKSRLKGAPQHGIGRTCKVGKEEIVGLLTALRLFIAEGDAARHARWLKSIRLIASRLDSSPAVNVRIRNEGLAECVPQLELTLQGEHFAAAVIDKLRRDNPSIHVDPAERNANRIIVNPMCLRETEVEHVARRLAAFL
jgi:D-glucosaminate-6-phosphate ammonia-lyase